MMFRTHVAFGILAGILALPFINPENPFLFIFLVAFASGLPDIDHPGSVMGRKVKIIGWIFDHRGFFHSLFAVALVAAGGFFLSKSMMVAAALSVGYLSHLAGDALTHEGIAPLTPLFRWRVHGFFSTGHLVEHLLFFVIVAAIIWVGITRFVFP